MTFSSVQCFLPVPTRVTKHMDDIVLAVLSEDMVDDPLEDLIGQLYDEETEFYQIFSFYSVAKNYYAPYLEELREKGEMVAIEGFKRARDFYHFVLVYDDRTKNQKTRVNY